MLFHIADSAAFIAACMRVLRATRITRYNAARHAHAARELLR